MTLASIIDSYGYPVLVLGTVVEGETVLVLGGLAAAAGYLSLPWVIVSAFFGSLCGDQLFFFLGRWHGQAILLRRPKWKNRINRAQEMLGRLRTVLILLFRFLCGLRTVIPFMIGMGSIPATQFIFLNTIGALLWATAVGTGGYLFGSALEILIGNIRHYEIQVFGAIAAIGLLIWIFFLYRGRKRKRYLTQSS
jgi:membrane protein DedA with SNARE-associated domain